MLELHFGVVAGASTRYLYRYSLPMYVDICFSGFLMYASTIESLALRAKKTGFWVYDSGGRPSAQSKSRVQEDMRK